MFHEKKIGCNQAVTRNYSLADIKECLTIWSLNSKQIVSDWKNNWFYKIILWTQMVKKNIKLMISIRLHFNFIRLPLIQRTSQRWKQPKPVRAMRLNEFEGNMVKSFNKKWCYFFRHNLWLYWGKWFYI